MKKKSIVIIAIVAVLVILIGAIIGGYNGLVDMREKVEEKQSTISTQLQRRADLIPNFVSTVKGYTNYEQETLTAVTQARSAVNKAATPADQAAASEELDRAVSIWVNAVTEAYPDLKADKQYIALQDELAGTENRIANARTQYNEQVRQFNSKIKKFPRSILAGIFGFESYGYFEADSGASSVPQVSFD